VIAVDTNILVYAHREDSEWYGPALRCVTGLAEGRGAWAIPWPCIHEFYAVATHPKIYRPASRPEQAIAQIEAWQEAPNLVLLGEDEKYWPALKSVIERGKVAGPMVHDAHIAALCLQHGISELWSADRDFSRFAGLRVTNPLRTAIPPP
jgi:toxin-antitoxin system PIN domain toxin